MIECLGSIVIVGLIVLGLKQPKHTAVLSPLTALFFVVIGGLYESEFVLLLSPIAVIGPCITIMLSKMDLESSVWPKVYAKLVLTLLITIMLCIILGVLFGPGALIGLVIFIMFVVSIIAYGLTSRHATAVYVMSTLNTCIRQNLPLAMALETASKGRYDKTAAILRQIRKWLIHGYSLGQAVKRGYPACYSSIVSMITAAERMGQLPAAFTGIEEDLKNRDPRRKLRPAEILSYPFVIIVIAGLILLGIFTFVIPQYKSVLQEMVGESLNTVTSTLLAIGDFILYEHGYLLWFVFALVLPWPLYTRRRRPRRPENPYLLSRIGDFFKWHLPLVHWFEMNFAMVQTVQALYMSLCAGVTVNGALQNVLTLDMNQCFKKRIRRWLKKVESGQDIARSARQCRLPETLAWAFDTKINEGNTLSVLELLKSFYRTNYSYRIQLTQYILCPTITLILGAIVAFIVLGIFLPGVQVITSLAASVVP